MKIAKRVGIWMDHSNARIMDYSSEGFEIKIVKSNAQHLDNQADILHSEKLLHNKEERTLKAYYKQLIDLIKDYDQALLFGPTDAKTELYNLIRQDHRYNNLKIETKSANKMSYEQQHDYIQDYFAKVLNYDSPFNK